MNKSWWGRWWCVGFLSCWLYFCVVHRMASLYLYMRMRSGTAGREDLRGKAVRTMPDCAVEYLCKSIYLTEFQCSFSLCLTCRSAECSQAQLKAVGVMTKTVVSISCSADKSNPGCPKRGACSSWLPFNTVCLRFHFSNKVLYCRKLHCVEEINAFALRAGLS